MRRSPPSGRSGLPVGLTALGLVLLLLFIALVIDPRVAAWVVHWRCPPLDTLVGILDPIGYGVALLVACSTLAVICRIFRWSRLCEAAWLGVAAFVVAGVLQFALKRLVGRSRPDAGLSSLTLMGPTFAADVDSFPSGHATSVFSVATVFASEYPRLRWPLYGLAAAVALGRVYLGRHYLSDILTGAVIGIVIASRVLQRRKTLPRWMRMESVSTQDRTTAGDPYSRA